MQKNRTEIKFIVKGFLLHGLTEATHVVALISIQLLPINLHIS